MRRGDDGVNSSAGAEPSESSEQKSSPLTCQLIASIPVVSRTVLGRPEVQLTLTSPDKTLTGGSIDGRTIGLFNSEAGSRGSLAIAPSQTKEYEGQITGPSGSASCKTRIVVNVVPGPDCVITTDGTKLFVEVTPDISDGILVFSDDALTITTDFDFAPGEVLREYDFSIDGNDVIFGGNMFASNDPSSISIDFMAKDPDGMDIATCRYEVP